MSGSSWGLKVSTTRWRAPKKIGPLKEYNLTPSPMLVAIFNGSACWYENRNAERLTPAPTAIAKFDTAVSVVTMTMMKASNKPTRTDLKYSLNLPVEAPSRPGSNQDLGMKAART
eukprot:CAMPEP_0183415552 /NCGR_PEP_ID=MMETSP0370-20130417/23180_1 /TAXON_ID=268820 /ORGANISM="Peridinium aciculiferum, Strain PAER-2" /LENGTH=114 /DNA_ID=CAMNT_0025598987 /DNA_START=397 /DNA_END=737 /DNA_ORIENTATION=+